MLLLLLLQYAFRLKYKKKVMRNLLSKEPMETNVRCVSPKNIKEYSRGSIHDYLLLKITTINKHGFLYLIIVISCTTLALAKSSEK